MNEYRFWQTEAEPTVHSLPSYTVIVTPTMRDAVRQLADQYNLAVHSIEGDAVWYVHRQDKTAV